MLGKNAEPTGKARESENKDPKVSGKSFCLMIPTRAKSHLRKTKELIPQKDLRIINLPNVRAPNFIKTNVIKHKWRERLLQWRSLTPVLTNRQITQAKKS